MKIHNPSGFSLVELMIAVGIGGAIILGIAALLMSAFTQSTILIDAANAEIDEMRAVTALTEAFSQAINVKYWTSDLNGYSGADGQIREFDSDAYWTDAAQAYPVAVFWREGQNSRVNPQTDAPPLESALKPTAIFFQKPRPAAAGARSTWGVLYISEPPPVSGTNTFTASRSDYIFEGFTRFQIKNISTYDPLSSFPTPGAPVTSFDIELTFRRFFGQNSSDPRSFCPESHIVDCPANVAYKDIVRTVKITLRNNTISESPSGPSGARLYDLIHFLHPQLPESSR